MRLLYVLASYLLFAVLFPVLSLHRKTRNGLRQRLGYYAPGELPPRGPGPTFWLHGASAGDLLALSPMFAPLRARFPGCRIVLSTMTNSGYMMGRDRLGKQVDGVVYAPYDLWGATRRAVRANSRAACFALISSTTKWMSTRSSPPRTYMSSRPLRPP